MNGWKKLGVCALLAGGVWFVFGQTLGHGFVNYDDNLYVYDNQEVLNGLARGGAAWAFTHAVSSNWHPLTLLSLMLDAQLYGANPGGYHLTNVQLHAAATILLFLVLLEMTGAPWRSGFVAALFAIHPLHVESVAWVSERKDVLSGVCFVSTLWAYTRYVRPPGGRIWYCFALACFALGLLSKPMLVTLPCLLIVLDYWPLHREKVCFWKSLREKVPFFALSFAICCTTLFTQKEAMVSHPLASRLGNVVMSYLIYAGQMVYPLGLAVPYPYPRNGWPLWEVAGGAALLLTFSLLAYAWRRQRPYLLMGWLWFLGMLVPVIGVVQVGNQSRADRYTYLPEIGLFLLATWLVADISVAWPRRRWVLGGGAALVLAALALAARRQASVLARQ